MCLTYCSRLKKCEYVIINENYCRFYSPFARYLINKSIHGSLYKKSIIENLDDLKFYWPIFDSKVTDIISGKNLYDPVSTYFSADRSGVSNSALQFYNGSYRIPAEFYFTTNFTAIIWAKPYHLTTFSFYDFGCEQQVDSIMLNFNAEQEIITFEVHEGIFWRSFNSNGKISVGFWNQLAVVYQNGFVSVFVNGTNESKSYFEILKYVNRTLNFFGKNYKNQYFTGELDDFKIFHRALSQSEILDDFNFMIQI